MKLYKFSVFFIFGIIFAFGFLYFSIDLIMNVLISRTEPPRKSSAPHVLYFDPMRCQSGPRNRIFVALNTSVLGLPFEQETDHTYSIGDNSGFKKLVPPDASAPLGCFDNPIQNMINRIGSGYKVIPFPGVDPRATLGSANVTSLVTSDQPLIPQDRWFFDTFDENQMKKYCHDKDVIIESYIPSLRLCRVNLSPKPGIINRVFPDPEDWPAVYVSPPDLYATPLGRPFVIYCQGGTKRGIGVCQVAYVFVAGVGIRYEFNPYNSRINPPLDQVIAFDKSLRETITSYLISEYKWPNRE